MISDIVLATYGPRYVQFQISSSFGCFSREESIALHCCIIFFSREKSVHLQENGNEDKGFLLDTYEVREVRSRHRNYLLKRCRVALVKEINTQDISSEPKCKENTSEDLINRLLLASNPPISSFRKTARCTRCFSSLSRILAQMPHGETRTRSANLAGELSLSSRTLAQTLHRVQWVKRFLYIDRICQNIEKSSLKPQSSLWFAAKIS